MKPFDTAVLPPGIRSRFVDDVNGLSVHILEAGFDRPDRPLVLMLHGFPEIAYSWRKVMPSVAAAGFHVVAPDLRGYGRTTGWSPDYDADLRPFRLLNVVRDTLGLAFALGYRRAAAIVGHDYGDASRAFRFRSGRQGPCRRDRETAIPLNRRVERLSIERLGEKASSAGRARDVTPEVVLTIFAQRFSHDEHR